MFNYKDKNSNISGTLSLTNSKVQFSRLNYIKTTGEKSEMTFDLSFNFAFSIKLSVSAAKPITNFGRFLWRLIVFKISGLFLVLKIIWLHLEVVFGVV